MKSILRVSYYRSASNVFCLAIRVGSRCTGLQEWRIFVHLQYLPVYFITCSLVAVPESRAPILNLKASSSRVPSMQEYYENIKAVSLYLRHINFTLALAGDSNLHKPRTVAFSLYTLRCNTDFHLIKNA